MSVHKPKLSAMQLSIFESDDFKSLLIEQKISLLAAMQGHNMLITGGGGVGKSHTIGIIEKNVRDIVLCGTTGVASQKINGQTLDSFMGFRGRLDTPDEAKKMSREVRERLSSATSILVDEGSMLSIDRFEQIDARLKSAKRNNLPFGGVQIIIVADFCQLKSVIKRSPIGQRLYKGKVFCFESHVWNEGGFTPYVLTEYVRHGNKDQRKALRHIRLGLELDACVSKVNMMAQGNVSPDALHIVTSNAHANAINQDAIDKLPGRPKIYHAKTKGIIDNQPVGTAISLKVGCRIMVCANNSDLDYYNGDLGVIIQLNSESVVVDLDRGVRVNVEAFKWNEYQYVVENNKPKKSKIGEFSQLPLKYAYAVTVHKCQGMTLKEAVFDLTGGGVSRAGTFDAGQGYVGLSRVMDFTNLKLMRPLSTADIKFDPRAVEFTTAVSMEALKRRHQDITLFNLLEHAA